MRDFPAIRDLPTPLPNMQPIPESDLSQSTSKQERRETNQLDRLEFYDMRIHGQTYKVGDWFRLHSPVIVKGNVGAREAYKPWTGPYIFCPHEEKSCTTFQTVSTSVNKDVHSWHGKLVVHFDSLKHCNPNRFLLYICMTVLHTVHIEQVTQGTCRR